MRTLNNAKPGTYVMNDIEVARCQRHALGERAAEVPAYVEWFRARDYDVQSREWINEGEGDYLPVGRWLLAGSGFRTDRRSHAEVERLFGRQVVGLTLVNRHYYHLDTAL